MNEQRELKEIGKDKFLLIIIDKENKKRVEKEYSRNELREIYDTLKLQYDQVSKSLRDVNVQMAQNKVKLTDEEERILKLMEKAVKRDQFNKLEQQAKEHESNKTMFETQMKEIKSKIPEVVRKK